MMILRNGPLPLPLPLLSLLLLLLLAPSLPAQPFPQFDYTSLLLPPHLLRAALPPLRFQLRNSGDATGFQPIFDLALPLGVTLQSAIHNGIPLAKSDLRVGDVAGADPLGCAAHPLLRDESGAAVSVCGPASSPQDTPAVSWTVWTLRLPFSSVAPSLPAQSVTVVLELDEDDVVLGEAYPVFARAAFALGRTEDDEEGDPSLLANAASDLSRWVPLGMAVPLAAVPRTVLLDAFPGGPSFVVPGTITADLAEGLVFDLLLFSVDVTAADADDVVLEDWSHASSSGDAGARLLRSDAAALHLAFDGPVVGTADVAERAVEIEYSVRAQRDLPSVLDVTDVPDAISVSLAARFQVDVGNGVMEERWSNTSISDELRTMGVVVGKTAEVELDLGGVGPTPGDLIRFNVALVLSDYHTLDNILVIDDLVDGFIFRDDQPVRWRVGSASGTSTSDQVVNATYDPVLGTTRIIYSLKNAGFTGPLVGPQRWGAVSLSFVVEIGDGYVESGLPLHHADTLTNEAAVRADVLDDDDVSVLRSDIVMPDTGFEQLTIDAGLDVHLTQYAVDGVICSPMPCESGSSYAALQNITFRTTYTMPSSDSRGLRIDLFLPDPLIDVSQASGASFDGAVAGEAPPAAGMLSFGPNATYPGAANMVLVPDENLVQFVFDSWSDPENRLTYVDVLITFSITTVAFLDNVPVTVLAQSDEFGIDSEVTSATLIVVRLPTVDVALGAVAVSGTTRASPATFVPSPPSPTPFDVDAACPRMGNIGSANLTNDNVIGISSNVTDGVDAGDIVHFAFVIRNRGFGALYDLVVSGDLSDALNPIESSVCVSRGDGFLLSSSGSLFGSSLAISNDESDENWLLFPRTTSYGLDFCVVTFAATVTNDVTMLDALGVTLRVDRFSGSTGGPNFVSELGVADLQLKSAWAFVVPPEPTVVVSSSTVNDTLYQGGSSTVLFRGENATLTVTGFIHEGTIDANGAHLVVTVPDAFDLLDARLTQPLDAPYSFAVNGNTMTIAFDGPFVNAADGLASNDAVIAELDLHTLDGDALWAEVEAAMLFGPTQVDSTLNLTLALHTIATSVPVSTVADAEPYDVFPLDFVAVVGDWPVVDAVPSVAAAPELQVVNVTVTVTSAGGGVAYGPTTSMDSIYVLAAGDTVSMQAFVKVLETVSDAGSYPVTFQVEGRTGGTYPVSGSAVVTIVAAGQVPSFSLDLGASTDIHTGSAEHDVDVMDLAIGERVDVVTAFHVFPNYTQVDVEIAVDSDALALASTVVFDDPSLVASHSSAVVDGTLTISLVPSAAARSSEAHIGATVVATVRDTARNVDGAALDLQGSFSSAGIQLFDSTSAEVVESSALALAFTMSPSSGDAGDVLSGLLVLSGQGGGAVRLYDVSLSLPIPVGESPLVAGSLAIAPPAGWTIVSGSSGDDSSIEIATDMLELPPGDPGITVSFDLVLSDSVGTTDQIVLRANAAGASVDTGTGGRQYFASKSAPLAIVTGSSVEARKENNRAMSIGDEVTMTADVTLAEGTTPLLVSVSAPDGVTFVNGIVAGIGSSITFSESTEVTLAGNTATFDFATAVNSGDNVANGGDVVTIAVLGRINDIPEVTSGSSLVIGFAARTAMDTEVVDSVTIDIVEPLAVLSMSMDKLDIDLESARSGIDALGERSEIVTIEATISNQGSASAHDISFELSAESFVPVTDSVELSSNGADTPVFEITGDNTVTVSANELDVDGTIVLTADVYLTQPEPGPGDDAIAIGELTSSSSTSEHGRTYQALASVSAFVNIPGPRISSAVAVDKSGTGGWAATDQVVIDFAEPTNAPTPSSLGEMLAFSPVPIGSPVSYAWESPSRLVVTIDAADGTAPEIGVESVRVVGLIRNAAETSQISVFSSMLTGSFGVPAPQVIGFSVSGEDGDDNAYSNGDQMTLTFDSDTNEPPVGTTEDLLRLIGPNVDLGAGVTGVWVSPDTLVLTVVDATGHQVTDPSALSVSILASGELRDASGSSPVAEGTIFVQSGTFGSKYGPLVVAVRADDPDDLDTVFSVDDTVRVTFNRATNEPDVSTAAAVLDLLDFGDASLNATGSWTNDGRVLTLRVQGVDETMMLPSPSAVSFSVRPAANLKSSDNSGPASNATSPTLAGDWGLVHAPEIVSAVASDPDDADTVFSDGDVLVITFANDTNTPDVSTLAAIYDVLDFSNPSDVGTNVTGTWPTPDVLVLTIVNATTTDTAPAFSSTLPFSVTTRPPALGAPEPTSEHYSSTAVVTGNWGLASGPRLVSATLVGDGVPGFGPQDTFVLVFDLATSQPDFSADDAMASFIQFAPDVGSGLRGTWTSNATFHVFVASPAAWMSLPRDVGDISVSASGIASESGRSAADGGTVAVGGQWDLFSAPRIVNVTVIDEDDADAIPSLGDVVLIDFDVATSAPTGPASSFVSFSPPIGQFSGSWVNGNKTLRLQVVNMTGSMSHPAWTLATGADRSINLTVTVGGTAVDIYRGPVQGWSASASDHVAAVGDWGDLAGPVLTSGSASVQLASGVLTAGDEIVLRFDVATDQVDTSRAADFLTFTVADSRRRQLRDLGVAYTVTWQTADTLRILITSTSGNDGVATSAMRASVAGWVRNAAQTSRPSRTTVALSVQLGDLLPPNACTGIFAIDSGERNSRFSSGDTLRVVFDTPTDMPPLSSKDQVNAFMTFTQFIGPDYVGSWYNATVLDILVIDAEGMQRPILGELVVRVHHAEWGSVLTCPAVSTIWTDMNGNVLDYGDPDGLLIGQTKARCQTFWCLYWWILVIATVLTVTGIVLLLVFYARRRQYQALRFRRQLAGDKAFSSSNMNTPDVERRLPESNVSSHASTAPYMNGESTDEHLPQELEQLPAAERKPELPALPSVHRRAAIQGLVEQQQKMALPALPLGSPAYDDHGDGRRAGPRHHADLPAMRKKMALPTLTRGTPGPLPHGDGDGLDAAVPAPVLHPRKQTNMPAMRSKSPLPTFDRGSPAAGDTTGNVPLSRSPGVPPMRALLPRHQTHLPGMRTKRALPTVAPSAHVNHPRGAGGDSSESDYDDDQRTTPLVPRLNPSDSGERSREKRHKHHKHHKEHKHHKHHKEHKEHQRHRHHSNGSHHSHHSHSSHSSGQKSKMDKRSKKDKKSKKSKKHSSRGSAPLSVDPAIGAAMPPPPAFQAMPGVDLPAVPVTPRVREHGEFPSMRFGDRPPGTDPAMPAPSVGGRSPASRPKSPAFEAVRGVDLPAVPVTPRVREHGEFPSMRFGDRGMLPPPPVWPEDRPRMPRRPPPGLIMLDKSGSRKEE